MGCLLQKVFEEFLANTRSRVEDGSLHFAGLLQTPITYLAVSLLSNNRLYVIPVTNYRVLKGLYMQSIPVQNYP